MAQLLQPWYPSPTWKPTSSTNPLKTTKTGKIPKSSTFVSPRAMFGLKKPPYEFGALEPFLSRRTLEIHWGKHHRDYVDNLNKRIEGTYLQRYTLEELIKVTYNNGNPMSAFNYAAQVWNHNLFWECMKPNGGGECKGMIKNFIERDFGLYDNFKSEVKNAAASLFGSGWVWLSVSVKDRKLIVEKTKNAVNPLVWGHIPLLAIDIWEHAYYLEYQDRRADYVSVFLKQLVSWDTVNSRFIRAQAFANFREPLVPEL
eukprot:TRINITY_DN11565_c0_g1_i1.p1 TRINITY_DN11565_c0_g1~~TRINITY_DN11565_c0_g1_i1.p1  ORF type:complete len:257 (+),score=36.02 TRINITY_DN11565_c0_g1_i1:157-927(+)